MPWWSLRDSVVEDYRKISDDVKPLSVRLDYPKILKAAETNQRAILFCDLQNGIDKWVGAGAVIFAGSKFHKFNLWIPDMESESSILLLRLIEKRYANQGRGYCYVSGWDC
jgi:micrococcal nuclease